MEQKSEQFLRKRKFLLILPLLILPFLLLGFWALGGGKGAAADSVRAGGGINTSLPGAKFSGDQLKDKLSLYEQRKLDSAGVTPAGSFVKGLGLDTARMFGGNGRSKVSAGSAGSNSNEAKIGEKLAEIRKVMSAPDKVAAGRAAGDVPLDRVVPAPGAETERLAKLMEAMKKDGTTPDPQLAQLNGMMDKILKIQHPELAGRDSSAKAGGSLPVVHDSPFRAIRAEIDGNQRVLPGGLVRMRLSDSVRLNGVLFLAGQPMSGSCTVTNQRLLLDIKSLRLGRSIVPVSLTVFSLDGLPGIDAPEAELGEAAGNGAAGALDNMEFLSMDQSLGVQAATAGISAAKGLLRKKVRKVRVKLHGGQAVLLRINQR